MQSFLTSLTVMKSNGSRVLGGLSGSWLPTTGHLCCLPHQPCRFSSAREPKRYYAENGEHDPPVQAVIERFHRLRWGAFIHPRAGRKRHLYRKPEFMRDKLQEHILTNRATSFMLDNMLNRQWRAPRYCPEDIYEPYHKRTGVPWDYRQIKPKFFP